MADFSARIAAAYARSAARIGGDCTLYRPENPLAPLAASAGSLPAAFKPMGKTFGAAGLPQDAWFDAHLDTTQVRPGDILAGGDGTFFVWQLPPLGAALCVRCNAVLALHRVLQPAAPGFNDLGAPASTSETVLMAHWPAALLRDGKGERSDAGLPGTGRTGNWLALLPGFPGIAPRVADVLVREEDGARLLVQLAERGAGWRLVAQEVST